MTKSQGCAALLDFVRCDLQLVAVGIAKINRVRDFVILEFEFDSTCLEFLLCSEKILPVRAKGQMKHSDFAMCGRFRLMVRGEQGDPGISFADKSWHAIPHAIMKSLEAKNVDVPIGRSFNVAHAYGYVINTFELHGVLDRMYKIYRVAQMIKVERVVLNALAAPEPVPSLFPVAAASDDYCVFSDLFASPTEKSIPDGDYSCA